MSRGRKIVIWAALVLAISVPIAAAAASPLLAWRDPVYITAGFAGIVGMGLLLVQPLLVVGYLPGLAWRGRQVHRLVGLGLVVAVLVHVGGLWITSPPDVVDVLLFRSPTPFSDWGAIAMWALFAAALLALLRRRVRLKPQSWRLAHAGLAALTVLCTVVHAVLIEGTMETMSKIMLSALVLIATVKAGVDLRLWAIRPRRQAKG